MMMQKAHSNSRNFQGTNDRAANVQMARLVAQSQRLVGCRAQDLVLGNSTADWLSISRMACALGDQNPLYLDPGYGARSWWHSMLAPPAFILSVLVPRSAGAMDACAYDAVDRLRRLDLTWHDHIRLGERLSTQACLVQADGIDLGDDIQGVKIVSQATYKAEGRSVATARGEVIVQPVNFDCEQISDRVLHSYSDEEIARIVAEIETEPKPQGARPRLFESVAIGDRLAPVTRGPMTWSEFQSWMVAEGRPAPAGNLRHRELQRKPGEVLPVAVDGWPTFDRAEARYSLRKCTALGLPLPMVRGAMVVALASQQITTWMGDAGFLRHLSCRLERPVFYGDVLRLTAAVIDTFEQSMGDGDRSAVAIGLHGVNQLGEGVLSGRAIVLLPRKGRPVKLPIVQGQV